MAYSRVKRVVNGIKALAYVLSVRGHNGAEKRNEIVTAINMCSSIPYQVQMEKYWRRAKSDHKTQLICNPFPKRNLIPMIPTIF